MKLLLKGPVPETRLDDLRRNLSTPWDIAVWDADSGRGVLAGLLGDANAMVAMTWPGDMPDAPALKLLQLPGAGYDRIAFDRVPSDAWVCNVFEHEIGIAEYIMCGMLEWCVGLRAMDRQLRGGNWDGTFHAPGPVVLHPELHGKTLGIVGYGHIGRALAARARPFGMQVVTCTRTPGRADDLVDRALGMDELGTLMAAADFIVIACPLTAATTGLIDARMLARMKSSAVLINVARGPIVDEAALFEACQTRSIGGAIIDVWYTYPTNGASTGMPSRFPFQDLDNVILSPHASGASEGLLIRRWQRIAANLDAIAEGRAPDNVLRRPGGPPPE